MQDIPLIAVMRSQIGKFSVDELTAIRLINKNCDYYTALKMFVSSDAKIDDYPELNNKINDFLNII